MRRAAGDFRESIVIRRLVQAADPDADLAGTPETVCSRRARFVTGGGRERQQHQQLAEGTLIVELPWDSVTRTISPQMDLLYGTRVLAIVAVENVDQLNETMRLTCTERVE